MPVTTFKDQQFLANVVVDGTLTLPVVGNVATAMSGLTSDLSLKAASSALSSEISRAESAEGVLSSALSVETTRAVNAEGVLSNQVTALRSSLQSDVLTLESKDGSSNNYQISTQGDGVKDALFISKGNTKIMEFSLRNGVETVAFAQPVTMPGFSTTAPILGDVTISDNLDISGNLALNGVSLNSTQLSSLLNTVVPPLAYNAAVDSSSITFAAERAYLFITSVLAGSGFSFSQSNWLYTNLPSLNGFKNKSNFWVPYLKAEIQSPSTKTNNAVSVDHIYAVYNFDLTHGPIKVTIPPNLPDEFGKFVKNWSVNINNYYANSYENIGNNNIGNSGYSFNIIGKNMASTGLTDIRCSTNYGLLTIRASVQDDIFPDYTRTKAFINAIKESVPSKNTYYDANTFTPLSIYNNGNNNNLKDPLNWQNLFKWGQKLISNANISPNSGDVGILRQMAILNLGTTFDSSWDPTAFSNNSVEIINGIQNGVNLINNNPKKVINNWFISSPDTVRYYQDYVSSCDYNLTGAYAAMPYNFARYYRTNRGANIETLPEYSDTNGNVRWQLTFIPPTDFDITDGSFWSVTNYQYVNKSSALSATYGKVGLISNNYYDARITGNDIIQAVDTNNDIGRYAIQSFVNRNTYIDASGNTQSATPIYDASGAVTIYISPNEPVDLLGNSLKSNWLPSPNPGSIPSLGNDYFSVGNLMHLMIRFYNSSETVREGLWVPAEIIPCDGSWTT